jgi:hypothetical protein
MTKEDAYCEMEKFRAEIIGLYNCSDIIDIKLEDYMNLSNYNKRSLMMVNNTKCINWEKKDVPIDPYIFGAWLGDGDHNGHGFTTIDEDIVKAFALWADTINAEITHHPNSGRDDCYHYGIRRKGSGNVSSIGDKNNNSATCIACVASKEKNNFACDWYFEKSETTVNYGETQTGSMRSDLNPFKELLKKHNLYKNKHIPDSYIFNDEDCRLRLLAGFIDTDGCIKQNEIAPSIEISQSDRLHATLIDKLDFIAQSLGFATSITFSSNDKLTKTGLNGKMKNLRIFGNDLHRIPTLLKRKQINRDVIRTRKTMHFSSFVVNPVGKGEFYGWSIDGNERFLLGNFVVTHNSRLQGGDDSASERYIFTQLNSLTRYLFPEADDAVLSYLNDDGTIVEPEYYVPIIPFALVNGISGIGTGFSCDVASYNPKTIIQYLQAKLANKTNDAIDFVPYYEGFKGTIAKVAEQKYMIKGLYEKIGDDKIRITELPVGKWTMPYTTFLESLMDGTAVDKAGKKIPPVIKDFTSVCTEVSIDFTVVFPKDKLAELQATKDANGCDGVEKLLKLFTTVSTTNMHMFDSNNKLHKYTTVEEIIEDFYGIRLATYQKRKTYMVEAMEKKLVKLSNRARYIQETLKGTIDLRRKTSVQVHELLTGLKFALYDGDFKYLVKMPMDSVTQENVESIMKEKTDTDTEVAVLKATTLEAMWSAELAVLDTQYDLYKQKREKIQAGGKAVDGPKKIVGKKIVLRR